ncbi:MAG: reverse transcriptase domain-containing protein [Pseudomonadota bacterium]
MEKLWQAYVKKGLRDQPVTDLYDYFDFHRNRTERFKQLSYQVSSGAYEPKPSLISRLEKKSGLCRPIVIPTPEDAVVLQCITEALIKPALKAQPSRNVFFSRSHSTPSTEFTFERDYIWFKRWKMFSKVRFEIASSHEWIVVTDVANYFDSIVHSHLRNQLAALKGVKEATLDLLFRVIPFVSWKPDYLPLPPQGLPQVQFDAPRLLSHVYLYEVDLFLKAQTGGSFVRWVDDITAAVANEQRGLRLIRDIDALMHTRGMRLNAGKTHILSKSQAYKFFHQAENSKVTGFEAEADKRLKSGKKLFRFSTKCLTSFNSFLKTSAYGQKDKVVRRYIGLFAKILSDLALDYCLANFSRDPSIREVCLNYFLKLGPRTRILNVLETFVTSGYALDEISLCQIAKLVVNWEIQPTSTLVSRIIRRLGMNVSKKSYLRRSPCYLVLAVWLLTKYGTPSQLARVLRNTQELWENSDYLARQVCAAVARFRQDSVRKEFYVRAGGRGFISAEAVIRDHAALSELTNPIPSDVRGYINNGKNPTIFGLHRILISLVVLRNTDLGEKYRAQLRDEILSYLTDPMLRKLVQAEVG